MNANSWLWFALIAFLVFCCLPMLFMGRHRRNKKSDATSVSDIRTENVEATASDEPQRHENHNALGQ